MMLWILALAQAAPDRVAAELTDVTGTDELRVVESIEMAAVLDGSNVHVLDLQTWDVTTLAAGCTAGGLALWDDGGTPTLAVGCDDGYLNHFTYSSGWSDVTETYLSVGSIYAVEYLDGSLYIVANGTGNAVAWSVDTTTDSWVTDQGAEEGEVGDTLPNGNAPAHMAASDSYVYIAHGSNSLSKIQGSTGAVSDDNATSPPAGSYDHVATWSTSSNALLTDTQDDQMTIYSASSSTFSSPLSDLDNPSCSVIAGDGAWVGISEDSVVSFWGWSESTFGFSDTSAPTSEVDVAAYDGVVRLGGYGDYVLAGTTGGLLVLTELAWVDITSDHSSSVSADTTLTFTSDTDGDYVVAVDGTELDSGTTTAGASVDVTLDVTTLSEGTNRVYVTMDDDGYDGVDITVDTPTPTAVLSAVSGGDGVLYLTMAAHNASDVDSMDVFISTGNFTADDIGDMSALSVTDSVTDAETSSTKFTLSTDADGDALENYTTYYVAARWVAGTDSGELSDVLDGAPVPSNFVTCDMRTDGECPTCSTTPAGALGLLGLLGLAGLVRRRKGVAAALIAPALFAPALLAPVAAQAQDLPSAYSIEEPKDYYLNNKDRTTEVRFGPSSVGAEQVALAYDRLVTLHVDGGVQLARFVELNGGVGLSRPVGSALLDDGSLSSEVSRLNLFPVSGGATFRLDPALRLGQNTDLLDHDWYGMPIVPYF